MGIKKGERIIVQKYAIWSCDEDGCTFSIEGNKGCCGVAPIMSCNYCDKLVCRDHRIGEWTDDGGYYLISMACNDPKCREQHEEKVDSYYTNLYSRDNEDD